MAIDHIPYPEAHNLARASDKGFYPVRIPVAHWQLRHYISTPEPDLLYFASRNEIYCLNTATKKRRHIATLPFEARCTASGLGYVCVGGEESGHFAAIKLHSRGGMAMDVDTSAGGVDTWDRERQPTASSSSSSAGNGNGTGRRAASVKVERIGEEIVNSISIHRLTDPAAHLDDIVAVLTNNDRTVRIYSLASAVETTVLDLPSPMNHATISPDGQTLVAVGDVNLAYFFKRTLRDTPPQIFKPHNRLTSASVEWRLSRVVSLHGSEIGGTVCYFTTAWSPSGALVAVGSEGGYITVFDAELLADVDVEDEDSVVAVVPGSRPDFANPHPGAIRSMMFSPEPWDLLVWAEDQGRVCIGDLRTGLKSRQVLNLEPKDENLRRITYEEVPGGSDVMNMGLPSQAGGAVPRDIDELEADFIRRYRHGEDATSVNFATEYIEARRRQRQQRAEMASMRSQMQAQREAREQAALMEDDPNGLTAREQQMIESLRTVRQREEARVAAGGPGERRINYTSADMFRDGSSTRSSGDSSTRPASDLATSNQDSSFPELSRTNAASPGPRPGSSHGGSGTPTSLPSLASPSDPTARSSHWAATTDALVRLSDGSRLPRRRASVVLTPPATNSPSTTASSSSAIPATRVLADAIAAVEENENPWAMIEQHMTLARGPLFDSTSSARSRIQEASSSSSAREASRAERTESDLQADLAAERARARSLARQRDRLRSLRDTPPPALIAGAAGTTLGPNPGSAERGFPTGFGQGNEILLRRAQMGMQMRGGYSGREVGVRTAGLAMSADGRVLWAACEEGIFEVEVGVKGRLFWGAAEPR